MAAHSSGELYRTVAQDVLKECRKRGETIPESLAIFVVRLTALNPECQSLLSGYATQDVIEEVKEICVRKLGAKFNPSTVTLKMQVFFDLNYRDREEFLKMHRQLKSARLTPMVRTISTRPCNTAGDMEHVYNEIIYYVITESGMRNSGDSGVFSEVKNVISSFFPLSQMGQFAARSRREKVDFIKNVASVALGLRLYLWHDGKAGYGMFNVSESLRNASPKFKQQLEFDLENTKVLIHKLERILKYYVIEEYRQNPGQSNQFRDKDSFSYWKSVLICMNQFGILMHLIKREAEALHMHASQMELQFRMCLKQLNSLMKSSSLIPKIFRLYKYLYDVWNCMQEDIFLLNSYTNVSQTLKKLAEQAKTLVDEDEITGLVNITVEKTPPSSTYCSSLGESNILTKQFEDSKISASKDVLTQSESGLTATSVESAALSSGTIAVSHADSLGLTGSQSVQSDASGTLREVITDLQILCGRDYNIRVIFPESVKNYKNISLHLQGFCPWALVCGNGVLLPAKRDIGIVAFDNCYYGFCCKIGAVMFLKSPATYVENLWKIAREKTELVFLLQIQDYFNIATACEKMRPNIIHPVFIAESGTQTVLHPVEKHIEPTYRWNQWDLRRLALKYVDMLGKQTHSTQTDLSHFRRENFSQVYLPKNNWSQTKRDGSTTMPKPGIPELVRKVQKTIL